MKKLSYIAVLVLLSSFGGAQQGHGQPAAAGGADPKRLLLSLGYVNDANRLQYLKAVAKTKVDGKFRFVSGIALRFYIRTDSPRLLIGTAVTNEKGEAVAYFPPGVRQEWLASRRQHFIAAADAGLGFPATEAETDMTKAKLQIDTASGRSVVVRLMEAADSGWKPVKGVDVRVAVRRMGGDLNIGESATYTTDSTGSVSAVFKPDSLPGDRNGGLLLVASVEESDSYGTLSTEMPVRWGVYRPWAPNYDERSLYARRGRSPFWLEAVAYSIILFVWGTLVYLLLQIRRLRRLGRVRQAEEGAYEKCQIN